MYSIDANDGVVIISDFIQGEDRINLRKAATSMEDIDIDVSSQLGSTLITAGTTQILLEGFVDVLRQSDFLFQKVVLDDENNN